MPFLSIDRGSGEPITRQIYARARDMILSGALAPGERMGSTRAIAQELGVSRNVVMNALDQLLAEGYLEARRGIGCFVSPGAAFTPAPQPDVSAIRPRGFRAFRPDRIDFRSGLPDLSLFPVRTWQRLSRAVWESVTPLDLSYGQPEGRRELREQVSRYLAAHRGVRCHPEQVLVTSGTTQAVGIVSRLLLGRGRPACILEDPITSDIVRIVQGFGGKVLPVPVDGQGLKVAALPRQARPGFIYVTPSHQFPLGGTLPIARRAALLRYARAAGAYVVEDDYDSEFRYDASPIGAIQGLDPSRVVYVGTFSKTLCPSLRMGYVVLPPGLVNRGRELKWFSDLHSASVDQIILARFIEDGHYVRWLHAMRKVYAARRAVLVEGLERRFGPGVEVLGSPAGIHLCARFPGVRFTPALISRIEAEGVLLYPVEEHAIRKGVHEDTLIFGFGMLVEPKIRHGLDLIARILPIQKNSNLPR
jgi:GntR family transcriptional regulator / MocR family aminotransferase